MFSNLLLTFLLILFGVRPPAAPYPVVASSPPAVTWLTRYYYGSPTCEEDTVLNIVANATGLCFSFDDYYSVNSSDTSSSSWMLTCDVDQSVVKTSCKSFATADCSGEPDPQPEASCAFGAFDEDLPTTCTDNTISRCETVPQWLDWPGYTTTIGGRVKGKLSTLSSACTSNAVLFSTVYGVSDKCAGWTVGGTHFSQKHVIVADSLVEEQWTTGVDCEGDPISQQHIVGNLDTCQGLILDNDSFYGVLYAASSLKSAPAVEYAESDKGGTPTSGSGNEFPFWAIAVSATAGVALLAGTAVGIRKYRATKDEPPAIRVGMAGEQPEDADAVSSSSRPSVIAKICNSIVNGLSNVGRKRARTDTPESSTEPPLPADQPGPISSSIEKHAFAKLFSSLVKALSRLWQKKELADTHDSFTDPPLPADQSDPTSVSSGKHAFPNIFATFVSVLGRKKARADTSMDSMDDMASVSPSSSTTKIQNPVHGFLSTPPSLDQQNATDQPSSVKFHAIPLEGSPNDTKERPKRLAPATPPPPPPKTPPSKNLKKASDYARGALVVLGKVSDTGIFDGIPVVQNVMKLISTIFSALATRESNDALLNTVHSMCCAVIPVVELLDAVTTAGGANKARIASDVGLRTALDAMFVTLTSISESGQKYIETFDGFKYVNASQWKSKLQKCTENLDRQLHIVSFAVTGQTYVEVLRQAKMLEELALGVFGTETHVRELKGSMATREQQEETLRLLSIIVASAQKQGIREQAKRAKKEALMEEEIPEDDLVLEDEPFAQGSFASVYKGQYCSTVIAAKVIETKGMTKLNREKLESDFTREVTIMKHLKNPNVVHTWGCCTTMSNRLVIVMEFAERGTLRTVLDAFGCELSLRLRNSILLDVARGMAYLHSRPTPVLHRDLKPQNVLVMNNFTAKIADFGLSQCALTVSSSTGSRFGLGGTAAYMAPEVLEGVGPLDEKSADVYSYGIFIHETLTGAVPYADLKMALGKLTFSVCNLNLRPRGELGEGVDRNLVELMHECWTGEARKRPTFEDVKSVLGPLVAKVKD